MNAPKAIPADLGISEVKAGRAGSAIVVKVEKFSAAANAGILAGDEIVTLNGAKVTAATREFLDSVVARVGVGSKLAVRVTRAGRAIDIAIPITPKPAMCLDLEEVQVDEVLERKIAP